MIMTFVAGDKDFESIQSRILNFDGEILEHKVQIAIYDNVISENVKKIFSVHLGPIFGVRARLMPSAMDVTIEENDPINSKKIHCLR